METKAELHTAQIGSCLVQYRNTTEFRKIHSEVFEHEEYAFESDGPNPLIIDCGAHIGLATVYFKQKHPGATVIAFEADERNVALLLKNVVSNELTDVRVIPAALWSDESGTMMYPDQEVSDGEIFTWGNTLIPNIWGNGATSTESAVKTVRLSTYIDKTVDFLKMDIEGCEEIVLSEISDVIKNVRLLRIEFHGTNTSGAVNSLARILALLDRKQFTYTVDYKDVKELFTPAEIDNVSPVIETIRAANSREWKAS
jgi:FkbM family methyltransferase